MTNLDFIRAHQYLYYVASKEVLTDRDYDIFGRDTGEDYKGGSDRADDYTPEQVLLAEAIVAGVMPPFPDGYSQ